MSYSDEILNNMCRHLPLLALRGDLDRIISIHGSLLKEIDYLIINNFSSILVNSNLFTQLQDNIPIRLTLTNQYHILYDNWVSTIDSKNYEYEKLYSKVDYKIANNKDKELISGIILFIYTDTINDIDINIGYNTKELKFDMEGYCNELYDTVKNANDNEGIKDLLEESFDLTDLILENANNIKNILETIMSYSINKSIITRKLIILKGDDIDE